MDKYFGQRQFCVKEEKHSYQFKLPNGIHVSVCRNMNTFEGLLGRWEVRLIASEKIPVSVFLGHKSSKQVAEALKILKKQTA